MASDLVVVIPTAGRPTLLERTLLSLVKCRRPDTYRKTIVVENGPRSGAQDIVARVAASLKVAYVYTRQANKSAALNEAIKAVDKSLIFFADDDVRFGPDVLCEYAAAAEGHDGGIFLGGSVSVDYEARPPAWLLRFLPPSAVGWEAPSEGSTLNQPIFLGCNWAAFSTDVQRLGGFDVSRGPGMRGVGQDTQMQLDLLCAGVKGRSVPRARVWHYVPASRCSTAWAVERAYTHAFTYGRDLSSGIKGPLKKYVGPIWWHFHPKTWLAQAAAFLAPDARNRFRAERWRSCRKGVKDGIRQG